MLSNREVVLRPTSRPRPDHVPSPYLTYSTNWGAGVPASVAGADHSPGRETTGRDSHDSPAAGDDGAPPRGGQSAR